METNEMLQVILNKIDGVDVRLSALEDGVNVRLSALEDGVNVRLSALEDGMTSVRAEQAAIVERLDRMQTDINEMQTDINEMRTDIDRMQTDIDRMQTDIDGIRTDINEMREDIGQIREDAEITRSATNQLISWAERASITVQIPLFEKDSHIEQLLRHAE